MKNKDKKSRKKLFVTLALLFGLAGVGTAAFAGYVLGERNLEDSVTNTPAEVVIADNSLTLEATLEGEQTLQFYPSAPVTEGRVTYDGDPAANLTLNLTVTLTGSETALADAVGQKIHIEVKDGGAGQAITSNYISVTNPSDTTITELTSYSIPINFGFGSEFNEKDFCEYFNNDPKGQAVTDIGTSTDNKASGTVFGYLNDFNSVVRDTTITIAVSMIE